ncbi:hypothetical protein [Roseomonas marmotae]|uniref:Lipoprotein n=1 Tax=Roseomonas marmotae TaxID=2768161 RepID=A0ABS3K9B2_9PROT|nr:hypothetical protein [Roseomonas marmotae]MBO1074051.1 hypothetical protein [Roseomonas marmotae]QTI78837.1 hypothetical protein IAI58_14440 [Roseomonas marmotae]
MPWSDRFAWRHLSLALLLVAAACGDLPQPYRGNPGGDAARLALPPAYRIAVPPPTEVMLPDEATKDLAEAMAMALREAEVPASVTTPQPLDLKLSIVVQRADNNRNAVVPRYTLYNADGESLASNTGAPVPLRAWSTAAPAVFKQLGERDAPGIASLLAGIEAARKETHSEALAGKGVPRLRLVPVTGAPGDGNTALTARMQEFLAKRGLVSQNNADGADFAVEGHVNMVDVPGNLQRVEVLWTVTRRDGYELGRVLQMNEVPKGSLNRFWADVAYVVAEEASAGIRDVLSNAGAPPGPQLAAEPPPRGSGRPPATPASAAPAPTPMPAAPARPARR